MKAKAFFKKGKKAPKKNWDSWKRCGIKLVKKKCLHISGFYGERGRRYNLKFF